MSDKQKKTEHESFGMVGLSRTSGQATLFGSSVSHQQYITLTISTAHHVRTDLHEDRIRANKEIIQIAMSNVQLGDMLTNMNVGDGVPCTIQRMFIDGKYRSMEDCPNTTKGEEYVEEFAEKLKALTGMLHDIQAAADAMEQKPTVTKADRRELSSKIGLAIQDIESNMPFILSMFNEKVEQVISEAKGEIEAFRASRMMTAGMKALDHGQPLAGQLAAPKDVN